MQSSNSWLIVSIWGDPGGWTEAWYRVPEIQKVEKCKLSDITMSEQVHNYKCTLGALLRAYSNHVSEAIVYVADTLAFSKNISQYVGPSNELRSYEDIVNRVKQYIEGILNNEKYVHPDDKYKVINNVVVLPNVGIYGYYKSIIAEFVGSPLNYYYGLLFDLYTRLTKSMKNKDIDTIILDVSHGVNFMPVLGFHAVIEVVKLYALEKSGDVRLVVLNSDPVIDVKCMPECIPRNMNIIYCEVYNREKSLRELVEHLRRSEEKKPYIMLEKAKPPDEVSHLNDIHGGISKNIVQHVKVLLESIDKGLPLPLVYTLEKLRAGNNVDNYLNKLINAVDTVIRTRSMESPKQDSNKMLLKVKHRIALNTPIELDLKTLVLLKALISDYEKFESKDFKYGDTLLKMYSLESLRELVEKYMMGAGKIIALHEISDIKMRVDAYETLCDKIDSPIPYRYIYDFTEQQIDSERIIDYYRKKGKEAIKKIKRELCLEQSQTWETKPSIDNKRIFFAHAGFYGKVTLVVVDEAKVYVGYIPNTKYEDLILET